MQAFWEILIGNLAVVSLVISVWAHLHPWLEKRLSIRRNILFGLAMGFGAVSSILLSVPIEPGVYLDFRLALIAVSGFFGGPLSALLTCCAAVTYRLFLGGAGTIFGCTSIALTGLMAVCIHILVKGRLPRISDVMILAGSVTLMSFGLGTSWISPFSMHDMHWHGLALVFLNFLSVSVAGLMVLRVKRFSLERDLFRAALGQSPDYYYIKDRRSRFTLVNQIVANYNGYAEPADMVGLTDFDLVSVERAQKLFDTEERIMQTDTPLLNSEECVTTPSGTRWFKTSKVPLRTDEGEVIGLAGVTRDITERKELERELLHSKNLLSSAMTEMSDGLAVFDEQRTLVFCNEQYRSFFPRTYHARVAGAHIKDILRAVVATGEQTNIWPNETEAWIEDVATNLSIDNDQEVHGEDGRWLNIRTRRGQDGTSVVVVADVTLLKQSELSLKALSDQLKVLADVDGLTGLQNRRSFDEAFERERKNACAAGKPLAVLMIDVDRFKAYNDHYGHTEGDHCLRAVAGILTAAKRRSGDVVGRYGGEEFVVLLPGTDEAGALAVAERFRVELQDRAIPHVKSEKGIVSASIGVTVVWPDQTHISQEGVIKAADKALYLAKSSGRDAVRFNEDHQNSVSYARAII